MVFSVTDVIQALIQQPDSQAARNYWKVLKNRLNKEGSESVTKCNRLKLEAADGKKYLTDVATAETHWTAHDLRRSFCTQLGETLHIDPVVIEKCLGHKMPKIMATYNRNEMLHQRKER